MKQLLPSLMVIITSVCLAKVIFDNSETLADLKQRLQDAVKHELYEQAAVIRDRIRAREHINSTSRATR